MIKKIEDKPLYKTLSSKEKIDFVLDQQEKGLNRKDIYVLMGYKKAKNLDDFMKNKGYVKENDLFVLLEEVIEESEGIQDSQMHDNTITKKELIQRNQVGDIGNLATLQDINIQEKLINMINHIEEYEEMLKWYKSKGSREGDSAPIVEVVTGLEINYPKTTNMKTSIRLDSKIWSRFKNIADTKFRHIDNPSLLSQALYEFLEKYDK